MKQKEALKLINIKLTELTNNRRGDKRQGLTVVGEEEFTATSTNCIAYLKTHVMLHKEYYEGPDGKIAIDGPMVPTMEYEVEKWIDYPTSFACNLGTGLLTEIFCDIYWQVRFRVDEKGIDLLLDIIPVYFNQTCIILPNKASIAITLYYSYCSLSERWAQRLDKEPPSDDLPPPVTLSAQNLWAAFKGGDNDNK